MNSGEKKVGIKKYIGFGILFALMIFYCIDEQYPKTMVIAIVQLLLVIVGAMVKKGTFPIENFYTFPGAPGSYLALAIILIIPFALVNDGEISGQYTRSYWHDEIKWPKSGLSEMLPAPISDYGRVNTNTELELDFDLYNVSQTRYESYVKSLKRRGFDDINYEFEDSYSAFNEEGYDLYCWISDDGTMYVNLKSPKKLEYLEWPDNELLELLPLFESPYGRIDADRSGYCAVCLGRIWEDDYKNFVKDCRAAGFSKNYERKSDYYEASDENGNLLLLDYDEDTKMMYLQIWGADFLAEEEAKLKEDSKAAGVVTASDFEEEDTDIMEDDIEEEGTDIEEEDIDIEPDDADDESDDSIETRN